MTLRNLTGLPVYSQKYIRRRRREAREADTPDAQRVEERTFSPEPESMQKDSDEVRAWIAKNA